MPFNKILTSKLSPAQKIKFVFDVLKSGNTESTCRQWKITSNIYKKYLQQILKGVAINLKKNYRVSNHPAIVEFRQALIKPYTIKIDALTKENIELNAIKTLLTPSKRGREYSDSERREIIKKVEQSEFPTETTLKCLGIGMTSFKRWKLHFEQPWTRKMRLKKELQSKYIRAVFRILHTPPKVFGINRTTWRIKDLHTCLNSKGFKIGIVIVRKIIRKAGYRFRKARKVLTSRDSQYVKKLNRIQKILRSLKSNEAFFSIDEFGPFAVKKRGGSKLTGPNERNIIPKFQRTKGIITLIGALELNTNQITFLHGIKPDTDLTISLVELLKQKYHEYKTIYLSWDAAAYHASKKLLSKINEINQGTHGCHIICVPLPAGSQFLNIIESVFGAMYRAVLANSDFKSRMACLNMIDGYFADRNEYYRNNPKRAGKKLWKMELTHPVFKASNNCVEKSRWSLNRFLQQRK